MTGALCSRSRSVSSQVSTPSWLSVDIGMRCFFFFFVTCASKPLSGTGHSKTNGAIARRNLSCTKGVDGVTQGNLQCTAEPRVEVSAGQQNVKSQCQASRSWQLMERQGSSPSTAGAPPQRTTCHQDCTSPGKEVCPVRPEKPARLRVVQLKETRGTSVTKACRPGERRAIIGQSSWQHLNHQCCKAPRAWAAPQPACRHAPHTSMRGHGADAKDGETACGIATAPEGTKARQYAKTSRFEYPDAWIRPWRGHRLTLLLGQLV